jgi:Zn-dependent M28 family amino/carboxypeptidase
MLNSTKRFQTLCSKIDPAKQRKWEESLLRGQEEFVDNKSVNDYLTRQEMQQALFYFKNHAYIMMVHYQEDSLKIKFQEDFFFEEMRKNKNGFAVINMDIGGRGNDDGLKTLIMGIKPKSDKIFTYNVDRNEVGPLFTFETIMSDFAHSVYLSNHLILTGGSDHSIFGKTQTYLLSALQDPLTTELSLIHHNSFPSLLSRRAKHCSFILRHHLFLIFGKKDVNSFADHAEVLNLRQLFKDDGKYIHQEKQGGGDAIFKHLEVRGADKYFV